MCCVEVEMEVRWSDQKHIQQDRHVSLRCSHRVYLRSISCFFGRILFLYGRHLDIATGKPNILSPRNNTFSTGERHQVNISAKLRTHTSLQQEPHASSRQFRAFYCCSAGMISPAHICAPIEISWSLTLS